MPTQNIGFARLCFVQRCLRDADMTRGVLKLGKTRIIEDANIRLVTFLKPFPPSAHNITYHPKESMLIAAAFLYLNITNVFLKLGNNVENNNIS